MAETRRLLVIDDEENMRHMLQSVLGRLGYAVRTAANGREGLAALDRHWIDLVITDINMPVMTGVELVENMADDPALNRIPVIMISTDGSTSRMEYLKSKGVRAYVRKPFTTEQIRSVVREVMLGR